MIVANNKQDGSEMESTFADAKPQLSICMRVAVVIAGRERERESWQWMSNNNNNIKTAETHKFDYWTVLCVLMPMCQTSK